MYSQSPTFRGVQSSSSSADPSPTSGIRADTPRPVFRHCYQSDATQLGESPKAAFVGLVREGRGEVRVSTMTAEEKRQLVRAKQSEISSFMKHAAVQAATRSGVHPKVLMGMRWMITRKPDSSQKVRLVLEFTHPQLGPKPTSPTVSRCDQLFFTVAISHRECELSKDAKTAICKAHQEIRKSFVSRVDGRTTCVVRKSRERHRKSSMDDLGNGAVFLDQNFV